MGITAVSDSKNFDVISIGHASYDLVFSVPHHPAEDEKLFADSLLSCGGGPAANAAVIAARLGFKSAFAGYLGNDVYGDSHLREFERENVDTQNLIRGDSPTPLSAILVKPDGKRALLNYKGDTKALPGDGVDFTGLSSKTLLFDGHEPHISLTALSDIGFEYSVLDAGSLHDGTRTLMDKVDYLVCSEKFALQYAGAEHTALTRLSALAPAVVITLGERGLIWQIGQERGSMPAPPIAAIDTTGAGDAFHGAFAAGLAAGLDWHELLRYASAAGALCCARMGARPGLPNMKQLNELLTTWHSN
ncbi:carbohydrate kinase family protein [Methylomonas sp. MgM2]